MPLNSILLKYIHLCVTQVKMYHYNYSQVYGFLVGFIMVMAFALSLHMLLQMVIIISHGLPVCIRIYSIESNTV